MSSVLSAKPPTIVPKLSSRSRMLWPWPPKPRAPSSRRVAISEAPRAAKTSVPEATTSSRSATTWVRSMTAPSSRSGGSANSVSGRSSTNFSPSGLVRRIRASTSAGTPADRSKASSRVAWVPVSSRPMAVTLPIRTSAMKTGAPGARSATSSKVVVACRRSPPPLPGREQPVRARRRPRTATEARQVMVIIGPRAPAAHRHRRRPGAAGARRGRHPGRSCRPASGPGPDRGCPGPRCRAGGAGGA